MGPQRANGPQRRAVIRNLDRWWGARGFGPGLRKDRLHQREIGPGMMNTIRKLVAALRTSRRESFEILAYVLRVSRWIVVLLVAGFTLNATSFFLSWYGGAIVGLPLDSYVVEADGKFYWGYHKGPPPDQHPQRHLREISHQRAAIWAKYDTASTVLAVIGDLLFLGGVATFIPRAIARKRALLANRCGRQGIDRPSLEGLTAHSPSRVGRGGSLDAEDRAPQR